MSGLIKEEVITLSAAQSQPPMTQTQSKTSNNLQDIAEAVIPSVVTIQSDTGEGSGIIMDEKGYIITNDHVVGEAGTLKIITHDGETYKGQVIGKDPQTDLALIKVDANNLTPATFGKSDAIRVADQVMAIGNPGGLEFSSTVTVGHVSALNRLVKVGNTSLNYIQTDTAINPGNSGGALVNSLGEVIGINTSKIVAEGYEGMGFSIPIDFALGIIENLKDHGYVKDRATIGISAQFVGEEEAQMFNVQSGIYVHELLSDQAKKVLKEKDIIVSFDKEEIKSLSHLSSLLNGKKAGDKVSLEVYRDHKLINLTIVLSDNS